MLASRTEAIIDSELPIIDAHHHLWLILDSAGLPKELKDTIVGRSILALYRSRPRYLHEELVADLSSGHRICATVFNDAQAMYRKSGPEKFRSVGEVEFVNGVAAIFASGIFGEMRGCAAIVSGANLLLGGEVEAVLHAQIRAGGGRLRGVRTPVAHDADSSIITGGTRNALSSPQFRAGVAVLHKLGLSLDLMPLEPQLPELIDLARRFPDTAIILNHTGSPLGIGRYAGKRNERFGIWKENMRALAECQNVVVKLGGLGGPLFGFKPQGDNRLASSDELVHEWAPYILTCIDLFGVERCMFESNFPVDGQIADYFVIWNAFKKMTAGASPSEKKALFGGTAERVYRMKLD